MGCRIKYCDGLPRRRSYALSHNYCSIAETLEQSRCRVAHCLNRTITVCHAWLRRLFRFQVCHVWFTCPLLMEVLDRRVGRMWAGHTVLADAVVWHYMSYTNAACLTAQFSLNFQRTTHLKCYIECDKHVARVCLRALQIGGAVRARTRPAKPGQPISQSVHQSGLTAAVPSSEFPTGHSLNADRVYSPESPTRPTVRCLLSLKALSRTSNLRIAIQQTSALTQLALLILVVHNSPDCSHQC